MLNQLKENSSTENFFTYFPYFNHKLYENPTDILEEYSTKSDSDSQNLEDSSTNTSQESIQIEEEEKFIPLNLLDLSPYKAISPQQEIQPPSPKKLFEFEIDEEKSEKKSTTTSEILPELQKYKLPKSLFCSSKTKKNEKEEKNSNKKGQLDSFVDKKLDLRSEPYVPKYKVYPVVIFSNQAFLSNNAGNKFGQIPINFLNYNNSSKNAYEKKKKKKKAEFVEREGDWSCYRCKNVNFSFREKCNKCLLSKEESEKKFAEVGEALLKLANNSSSINDKKSKDDSK